MRKLKKTFILLLALCIAMGSYPVQAKAPCHCPMMAKGQQMVMKDGKPCPHCLKMAKEGQQKKGGCCDDPAKCSMVSGQAIGAFFPAKDVFSASNAVREAFTMKDGMLLSLFLQTQDRPPKSLS